MAEAMITGLGVVSPSGMGRDEFLAALRGGRSGVSRMEHIDTSRLKTTVGGHVATEPFDERFPAEEWGGAGLGRFGRFAAVAASMAVGDADLDRLADLKLNKGVFIGTSAGPVEEIEAFHRQCLVDGVTAVRPSALRRTRAGSAAEAIATQYNMTGDSVTLTGGCAASLGALLAAAEAVESGRLDIALVGGVECPLAEQYLRLWDVQHVLTREHNDAPAEASRPFAEDRAGMVLAEAAAFVVLESRECAEARNARTIAELRGVAAANDPQSDVDPQDAVMERCMGEALDHAGLSPDDIQHLQAHGSSCAIHDLAESKAIRRVFGNRTSNLPVGSIKSMTGHPLGASGMLSVVAVALGMQEGFAPPSINADHPDPRCNLRLVGARPLETELSAVLVNAFGFGGKYASVVLRKA